MSENLQTSNTAVPVESAKAGTIRRLLHAALHEFARNGYAAAKVDDIARSAGVTKQLVYHYYKDKRELFICVLDEMLANNAQDMAKCDFSHLAPQEAFCAFVDKIIDQFATTPLLGPIAIEGIRYHNSHSKDGRFSKLVPTLAGSLRQIIDRGISTYEFREDIELRALLALIVLTATGGFTNRYLLSTIFELDSASPEGIAFWRKQAVGFLLHSILVSPMR